MLTATLGFGPEPDAVAMAREAQAQEWALWIALARHYRPFGWLGHQILSGTKVPLFIDQYRDTLMTWLIDTAVLASEHAVVRALDPEYSPDPSLTTYIVSGATNEAEQRALAILEQRFGLLGCPCRLISDFCDLNASCCILNLQRHDPDAVVSRMTATTVQYCGTIYRRRGAT